MNFSGKNLEVHLDSSALVTTHKNYNWAFALNDPHQPYRDPGSDAPLTDQIHDIIDYLDVEDAVRYAIIDGKTFCNIYAYDYCYLCRAYIPRVWWDRNSIDLIKSGHLQQPKYDTNVFELNANSLYNWFEEFGSHFDWKKTDNLTELQDAANAGQVAIIVAKRKLSKYSGHITAVVPETHVFQAHRYNNKVVNPVESQAGSNNYEYIVKPHQWWMKSKFSGFGFWIHE